MAPYDFKINKQLAKVLTKASTVKQNYMIPSTEGHKGIPIRLSFDKREEDDGDPTVVITMTSFVSREYTPMLRLVFSSYNEETFTHLFKQLTKNLKLCDYCKTPFYSEKKTCKQCQMLKCVTIQNPETCAICLDKVKYDAHVLRECGHQFHLVCVKQLESDGGWFDCPVCKTRCKKIGNCCYGILI